MKRLLIGFALLLSIFIFIGMIYLPSYTQNQELKRKDEKLEEKILTLELENQRFREEEKLLQSDVQYLEKVLREDLGLVKPGEVIYKLVEETK